MTLLKYKNVSILKGNYTDKLYSHVRVSNGSSTELGNSTHKEEIKVTRSLGLGDLVLDLFKDSVLNDGVDDQHQSSTNTSIETGNTFSLEDMSTNRKSINIGLLFTFNTLLDG